jgi:hypothetical protein
MKTSTFLGEFGEGSGRKVETEERAFYKNPLGQFFTAW